jgi:hypothetical protein
MEVELESILHSITELTGIKLRDCWTNHKDPCFTSGDIRINNKGEIEPCETVLSHPIDQLNAVCLDYIMEVVGEEETDLKIKPDTIQVQKFPARSSSKYSQLSDHYGLSIILHSN